MFILETGPPYCQNILAAFLYFLGSTINTFQLSCGMLTPTLFDVVDVLDLRPIGNNFDPNKSDEDTVDFDINRASFDRYIEDYNVSSTTEVTAEEHIGFLALWLSRCIFCCRSLKVTKRYLTLSNQLHEGKNICLRQLRLNATFKVSPDVKNPNDNNVAISGRRIEGTGLNLLTLTDKNKSDQDAFFAYFPMFTKPYHFNAIMTPFSKRTYGPEWVTHEFPANDKQEKESKRI